jgi:hypothetical protein
MTTMTGGGDDMTDIAIANFPHVKGGRGEMKNVLLHGSMTMTIMTKERQSNSTARERKEKVDGSKGQHDK